MFGVEPNSRAILSNPEDGESGTSFPSQPSSRWSTRWYIHLKVLSESRAYSSGKVATSRIYPLPPCTFLGCQCTDPCYTRFMLQAGPSTFDQPSGRGTYFPGPSPAHLSPTLKVEILGCQGMLYTSFMVAAPPRPTPIPVLVGSDTFGRVQSGIPTQRRGPRRGYG